jgi:hypothetical protein
MARSARLRWASMTRRLSTIASGCDDALVLASGWCEWCGHAPALEVDLSSPTSLDLIATISSGSLAMPTDCLHRDARLEELLVEQPMATSARPLRGSYCSRPGSTSCWSGWFLDPRRYCGHRRQGGQGSRLSRAGG